MVIRRTLRRTGATVAATVVMLFSGHLTAANAAPEVPDLILARLFHDDIEVTAYLVSEKYDGARALWDGQSLRFRSGNPVQAPTWFIEALPKQALDGELWLGRGQFDQLSAIVRRTQPIDDEWRRVRYMVFELPGADGPFRQRAEQIRDLLARLDVPWLQAVDQQTVADLNELTLRFNESVRNGAEGLMLHRADAPYVTGRSDVLLKLKPTLDAEATVVGYEPGRGKLAGLIGALKMQTAEGKIFSLGSGLPRAVRLEPPPLGTRITYRYQEMGKSGLPRFPRYWRVREEF